MYTKIYGYRWMTTGGGSSPSPAVLYVCPHLASKRQHRFRPTLGWTEQLNSLVCTSIRFVWYGLGFSWWCLLAVGGWVAFLVVVIASSGRNDVVSGLGFQGLPSHFFSFTIYFEIDKYYPVWTGPDQARPVHDCQSGARSSPTFRLDRTGLSPTPDRVRPDWWNHCISLLS